MSAQTGQIGQIGRIDLPRCLMHISGDGGPAAINGIRAGYVHAIRPRQHHRPIEGNFGVIDYIAEKPPDFIIEACFPFQGGGLVKPATVEEQMALAVLAGDAAAAKALADKIINGD